MNYSCIGFHGTLLESAISIIQSQYNISQGKGTYLGDGVYFFENKHRMATEFIVSKHEDGKYAVLGSKITAKRDNILDLASEDDQEFFHAHRERLLKALLETNTSVFVPPDKNVDGFIINDLCKQFPQIQVVRRRSFSRTYRDVVLGKSSSTPNVCVVCVRDVENCIRETRLVEEGDIGEFRRNVPAVGRAL